MTSAEPGKPRKFPVWPTVGACYAAVACNFGQLVRISWLWLLIMIPAYAAVYWLVWMWAPWVLQIERAGWVVVLLSLPPYLVIELPFLASLAVAWHRLILRRERLTGWVYLRLDRIVWLYALYLFLFLLLLRAPVSLGALLLVNGVVDIVEFWILLALLLLPLALLLVPRYSLVLPAAALGERLPLRQARLSTRANTLRLALATCLCVLPAFLLFALLPNLLAYLEPALAGADTPIAYVVRHLLHSFGYPVFNSIGHAVLGILAVTLLSLTYRFFAAPSEQGTSPPA